MSVAFRRESDEEHLEPRFELPIPPGPNLVTPRGLALMKAQVSRLEGIASPSDEEKRDLRYWRTRLATAEIAPDSPADEVAFGSTVKLRLNGQVRTLTLVGSDEADPANGLLAFTSPIAQALIGGYAGEAVGFDGRQIDILSIESGDR
ncbi:GreA/GreB family elongation factor [Sphingomonas sp. ID0503]|uniref:GreA/GreB family elongation factor n=1 Tax=Sphingomonas sp. ID0503 TaxID=3399691 RepID=UPI003AFAA3AB